jgi:Sulfotransferase family
MERFVVGTGRCGSTLLSRMLAEHPGVLSINEFFTGLDWSRRFPETEMTGHELAELISTANAVTTEVLSRGYTSDEITYPFAPGSRFARGEPVPWVLISTLGLMSEDPDSLFDQLVAYAQRLDPAPAAAQYRRLFDWLTERMDRDLWIERSGSSVDYLGDLVRLYPEARFVHIHRDGHEAALSIRAHPFYRLAVSLLYPGLAPAVADDDMVVALLESVPAVEWFGRYWSDQLVNGFSALPRLDRDQYLAVRFEDLVGQPATVMAVVADFFELPADDGFVDRAAALVRGVPPTRFDSLDEDEQERLSEACAVGMRLLGRS